MATTVREEATRKSVHVLVSLVAAAVVWILSPEMAAVIIAGATFVALSVEAARSASGGFGRSFDRHLGHLLRTRERGRLTGATMLAIAYTVTVVLFPGGPALAGIFVAGVADAAAAVAGKRFGRRRYPGGKSLEGSLVFLAVVVPILLLTGLPLAAAAAVALLLTAVEALTLPVDDNLYLPILTAFAVHVAGLPSGLTFFS